MKSLKSKHFVSAYPLGITPLLHEDFERFQNFQWFLLWMVSCSFNISYKIL